MTAVTKAAEPLALKLVRIREELPYLQKDKQGYGYKYTPGSSILSVVQAAMNTHRVMLQTEVTDKTVDSFVGVTDKGKEVRQWSVVCQFRFTWIDCDSAERMVSEFIGAGQDPDISKAVGKALTYTERYHLLKTFSVPTDEDDPDKWNGAHETGQAAPKPETKPEPVATYAEQKNRAPKGDPKADNKAKAGQYVMPVGKRKGQKLEDIPVDALTAAAEYMRANPSPEFVEPLAAITNYLDPLPF